MYTMNRKISQFLTKAVALSGALLLGWAVQAQSTGSNQASSDTTVRHSRAGGGKHMWAEGPRRDSLSKRDGFRRGGGRDGMAFRGQGRDGFRREGFGRGDRRGWAGRNSGIHYTPEQRRQVMAIDKEYRQKTQDLYKKDNSTLREYKAGLLALFKEKKSRLEALLTQQQKDERAARTKRMVENGQVMAAARMERLKLRLNLSDDQVAKIKAGEANLHSQMKAIHDNDNLLPQQKMEQMKDLMTKNKDVVKSVLTPDQQAQFEKMSNRRGGRPGGWDRSRQPGRGGDDRRPENNPGGIDDNKSK